MKRIYQLLLLSTSAVLLVMACTKQKTYQSTTLTDPGVLPSGGPTTFPTTNKISLNELFKDLRPLAQTKCVTAGVLQRIMFAKGTRLTFYPNSFIDASGNTITSGTVCIDMVEMYSAGDMIANRATTVSKGDLLTSGGQVHINATKDGMPVYVRKYGIGFMQQAASTQPMALYFGNTANTDSVVTWGDGSTAEGMIVATTDTVSDTTSWGSGGGGTGGGSGGWVPVPNTGIYYQFDSCTDFRWINCDYRFTSTATRRSISVNLPDTSYNGRTTQVYFILPEINCVFDGYQYSKGATALYLSEVGVPEGMTINVVTMAKKGDKYYYAETIGATVIDGLTIDAALEEKSLDYVRTKLSEL